MDQNLKFKSNKSWMAVAAVAFLVSSTSALAFPLSAEEENVVMEYATDSIWPKFHFVENIVEGGDRVVQSANSYTLKTVPMTLGVAAVSKLDFESSDILGQQITVIEPEEASECGERGPDVVSSVSLTMGGNRADTEGQKYRAVLRVSSKDIAEGPCTALAKAINERKEVKLKIEKVQVSFYTKENKRKEGEVDTVYLTLK